MNIVKIMPQVAFGKHYVTADVGASVLEGSLKLIAKDEDGGLVAEEKGGTVFNEGDKRTEELFEERIAQKIADFHDKYRSDIVARDPEGENGKTDLVIDYPGPIKAMEYKGEKSNGPALTNFFYDDSRSDEQRFKRPIVGGAIDSYLKQRGINLGQTRHVNDMAAGGASILQNLRKNHSEVLEDGSNILFLYPGGGLGSGEIIVDKDNIKIHPTEKQHTLGYVKQADGTYKIGHIERNVQLSGLMRNFALAAVPESQPYLQNAIMNSENGKIMDNYEEFNKDFPDKLTKDEHARASHSAITNYMEALSQVIGRQIANTDTNTVVVTGKIANGIAKSVAKNSYFEGKTFDEVLKEHTFDNLPEVGRNLISKDLEEFKAGLKIILMPLENNTEGAYLLANADQVGNPPKWYNMPKSSSEKESA